MSEAEDRKTRSTLLQVALEEHFSEEIEAGRTDMLGDWLVVACTVSVDADGDPIARYHMSFSGGSMLEHHAFGLLEKAKEMLSTGTLREEADNDDD